MAHGQAHLWCAHCRPIEKRLTGLTRSRLELQFRLAKLTKKS